MRNPSSRPGLVLWALTPLGFGGVLLAGFGDRISDVTFGSPWTFFWLVVVGAALCWVGGIVVMVVGIRDGLGEVAILGAVLTVAAGFGVVHGVAVPGALLAQSSAMGVAALVSMPCALVVATPLLAPSGTASRWAATHYRTYAAASVTAGTMAAVALIVWPDALPEPRVSSFPTLVVAALGVLGGLALSYRQLRLYWLSDRTECLVASLALSTMAVSGVIWINGEAFTLLWWLAHGFDVVGVLAVSGALIVGYRPKSGVAELLAPVLARDPLAALELGFAPLVHRFVDNLETKDHMTRDHVVRVGELAVRAGTAAGLSGARLRRLGIAALLHDVGKLGIPNEILTKPGRLSAAESEIMRTHTVIGYELLMASPALADAAPLVRAHHERPDGTGYPDSLLEEDIPFEAGIISACDAYDAMARTRHYREGMGTDRAIAILKEHSGSQWLPEAVDAVVSILPRVDRGTPAFDAVGRRASDRASVWSSEQGPNDVCSDVVVGLGSRGGELSSHAHGETA